ncbi:phosphoribosylanthranilate isomerase [uncultured Enterovirga sp.]|uniref:phosphoribosylanthranilate isomerase n=1 Tax=uncultured Enterovirga sp. TaxID=2026352 RepID=UPI0035CC5285
MTSFVKICGLSTPDTLSAALDAGADMVGFVRFARSPRHLGLNLGRDLSLMAKGRAERVLLVVDPDDRDLDEALLAIEPDVVQLHGVETPERAAAIRARYGLPVMKAIGIESAADLAGMALYRGAADRILLDAKPPRGSDRPGGNGAAFDWHLLDGFAARAALDPGLDIVLSGGLTPDNVAEAVATTGLRAVDVSSGVETRPGEKDPSRITAFIRAARAAFASAEQRRRVA